MRAKVWAGFGVVLLLIVVAMVNSRRASHDRAVAFPAPAPSVTAPVPSSLEAGCDLSQRKNIAQEAHVEFGTASHPDLVAVSVRCLDAAGDRQPSLVKVLDIADDHRIVATLIRPAQHLHVLDVTADSHGVLVTASEAGPPLPHDQKSASDLGSVFRWRFTTSDGLHYIQSDPERVAFACGPADLKITAANNTPRIADAEDLASHQPSAGIVRIRNVSDRPCALEGYPQITGITQAHEAIPPNLELFGVSGGLKSGTAPQVILLEPGKTASAAVDSADETPAGGTALCNTLTALTVALPTGEPLGTVNLLLRVCDFQVHPLVPGGTGTMN